MRCGAFHRVEGTLCLVRHGQAALSGSKTKAPGFAGGLHGQAALSGSKTKAPGFAGGYLLAESNPNRSESHRRAMRFGSKSCEQPKHAKRSSSSTRLTIGTRLIMQVCGVTCRQLSRSAAVT
jgi:hypothetical protein